MNKFQLTEYAYGAVISVDWFESYKATADAGALYASRCKDRAYRIIKFNTGFD